MRVAALQLDVRREDPDANLAAVEAGLRRAAERDVRLVVLPEMWPTSFPAAERGSSDERRLVDATRKALERLAAWSAELGMVVAGSALAAGASGEAPRNRLHVFEGGRLVLAYDKVHLFSPTAEPAGFTAGDRPPSVAETAVGRLAGVVCYDLRFGPLTRQCFAAGAEVLVCPAQWPRPRAGHFAALARGRAVENQCFVVAANRIGSERIGRRGARLEFPGRSIVAAPDGRLLARGGDGAGLVEAEIELELARRLRARVPVEKDQRPDLYRTWG